MLGHWVRLFGSTAEWQIAQQRQLVLPCQDRILIQDLPRLFLRCLGLRKQPDQWSFGLFGLLALRRDSLRPGMVAHAWADIFGGIILKDLPYK
jgi:hypothetical protein